MELGGKSPNIFFADVMDQDDDFLDKTLEGFALFAFNKGEVCTCPSRALVQESIFEKFMEKAVARVARIKVGNPLDLGTQMGPQCSQGQLEKILGYIDIGKQEGAKLYGLGAGVWSRNANNLYRVGRGIEAGRVWTNCYHQYPAHAAFGGYKHSGFGRETHKMILDHYQQTKNMLVSYSTKAAGLF
ncbi:MAG: aldehyde dehydrogenase family protein [Rhizomicrobium sp.]